MGLGWFGRSRDTTQGWNEALGVGVRVRAQLWRSDHALTKQVQRMTHPV